jgi:hypothetical protein
MAGAVRGAGVDGATDAAGVTAAGVEAGAMAAVDGAMVAATMERVGGPAPAVMLEGAVMRVVQLAAATTVERPFTVAVDSTEVVGSMAEAASTVAADTGRAVRSNAWAKSTEEYRSEGGGLEANASSLLVFVAVE